MKPKEYELKLKLAADAVRKKLYREKKKESKESHVWFELVKIMVDIGITISSKAVNIAGLYYVFAEWDTSTFVWLRIMCLCITLSLDILLVQYKFGELKGPRLPMT